MHARHLVSCSLVLLAVGCVTEGTEGVNEAAVIGPVSVRPGTLLPFSGSKLPSVIPDGDKNPPYPEVNFDLRLEAGAASREQPVVSIEVQRLMVRVDGNWRVLSVGGEPVDLLFVEGGRWPGLWEGALPVGRLTDVEMVLGEYATVTEAGVASDWRLTTESRNVALTVDLPTDGPQPLVVTSLFQAEMDDGDIVLVPSGLLVREVDEDGYAHELQPD